MTARPVVLYYRVSSKQQQKSGLGLLAQRDAVGRYLYANPARVIAELTEIESGRRANRPRFEEALWLCRVYNARLIVARLDRLARSAALIAKLLESRLDFVAADLPLANRFTVHILAAVAEYESRLISERTKAAMTAAKLRGRTFGGGRPRSAQDMDAARDIWRRMRCERVKARALDFAPLLVKLRDRGETLYGITVQLSLLGIDRPFNGRTWRCCTVRQMFELAGERLPALRCSRRSLSEHKALLSGVMPLRNNDMKEVIEDVSDTTRIGQPRPNAALGL